MNKSIKKIINRNKICFGMSAFNERITRVFEFAATSLICVPKSFIIILALNQIIAFRFRCYIWVSNIIFREFNNVSELSETLSVSKKIFFFLIKKKQNIFIIISCRSFPIPIKYIFFFHKYQNKLMEKMNNKNLLPESNHQFIST